MGKKQKCSSIYTEMLLIRDGPGRSMLGPGRSGTVCSSSGTIRSSSGGPGSSVLDPCSSISAAVFGPGWSGCDDVFRPSF